MRHLAGAAARVKDVARAAGVSTGTVSNVLHRPDLVTDATRDRVLAAMEDVGFDYEECMRSGPHRPIALVVIDSANPFFMQLTRGAEEEIVARGDLVVVANSSGDVARERRYLDVFAEQRVRGLLLAPTHHEMPDLEGLELLGIPIVCLDRHLPGGSAALQSVSSVYVDDVEGGRIAGRHLVELGHRQVFFAGGPMSLQQVRDRLEGFREVIAAAGGSVHYAATEALTIAEGRTLGARLDPADPQAPTALFAANDLVAMGVLNELRHRGFAVPADLSIIGYDDIEIAATTAVPLSSVHQPAYDIGRAGAGLLYERLAATDGAGDGDAHVARHVRFEPRLVVRASTAAAPHAGAAAPHAG